MLNNTRNWMGSTTIADNANDKTQGQELNEGFPTRCLRNRSTRALSDVCRGVWDRCSSDSDVDKESPQRWIYYVVILVNVNEEEEEITDEGRYGYLFEHLKAKFLSRKSYDTLVDHLQEVIVESLPTMNKEETDKMIAKAMLQEHGRLQAEISSQIQQAIDNHIPSLVDESDIAIWLALQMKFETLQVPQTTCRTSAVRPRDQDDPHDDAPPKGGERHSNQEQVHDYDFWTESYASDDDEIPTKQVSQDIMEEVSLTINEAKLKKNANEIKEILASPHPRKTTPLVQSCQRDPEAPALSLINQDLLYLKKGNSGPEKIVLSLHKFPAIIFNDVDIEERTSRWELGHEHKFITEIVARRANECIVSITESDYKNLNKNDIEDIYLLIMNGKALGYQNPFYLKKAQRIKPTLYDGSVISSQHAIILVIDDEETLILEELNQLSEDFGKRFVPRQELYAELAFWLQTSNPNTKQYDISPGRIEAPSELPKIEATVQQRSVDKQCFEILKKELFLKNDRLLQQIMSQDVMLSVMNSTTLNGESMNLEMQRSESCDKCFDLDVELLKSQTSYNELLKNYFENNDLKAQLQAKDTTIRKLKEHIKSMRENDKEEKVKQDMDENETMNIELEHRYKRKPTGSLFTLVGNSCPLTRITPTKVVPLKETTSHSVIQIVLWYLDSGCSKHMTGNHSQLMNIVTKFVGTVRFINDQIAEIIAYGDYQLGNEIISMVYYVENLGHNLFSVRQFCDADLRVAFQKNTCFIRNLEGVDLLLGSRDTNLYKISLDDMLKTSSFCLLSKASKTKSWLWHRRLSHLNFGTLNKLAKDGLARGIPNLKFKKDHQCSTCALGKSKKSSHQPKAEDTNQENLYGSLWPDVCGEY
ncbi:retrovirus-related pol polyprotein from transposon TNT 1-94 [Tanacetum coccineum]